MADQKIVSEWLRELADRIDSLECNRLHLRSAGGRIGPNGKWKLEE